MPNISFYIDEDLYLPLKSEAERKRKDLYRFVRDVLKEACEEVKEVKNSSKVPPRTSGWMLVDCSPNKWKQR